MGTLSLNLQSDRAKKARIATKFDGSTLRALMLIVAFTSLASWVIFVFFVHIAAANLLLVPVGLLLTPLIWYNGELRQLRPSEPIESAQDISSVLDRQLLAKLNGDPTPLDIANAVSTLPGGYFYAARFGIDSELLKQVSSKELAGTIIVWQTAIQHAVQHAHPTINSATVAMALILAVPNHDNFLAYLKIDGNDIVNGVSWYAHTEKIIEYQHAHRNFGGIGRDLSFGWAPLLSRVGQNITEGIESGMLLRRSITGHQDSIDQLIHLMSQSGKRNAVLVGEVGVGKTTIAHAFAQTLIEDRVKVPENLRYRQIITLDAANLLANAKGQGQIEELLIHVFNEAISARNVILFLDEAQLFLKEGTGTVDLSSILLPVIEGGGLPIILSLNQQEWLRLSQENSGLAQMMNMVAVNPLGESDVYRVMEDQVLQLEAVNPVVYMQQSLKEAYVLADRYIHEQAFPGKAIKLLEASAGFAEQGQFITAKSVQQAVEKSFGVKVQVADTKEEKDALLNMEALIHERMINQTRAVKVVSDALRRARAGVRNSNKPIGTFLFLGPTGVGKTELSKSLAAIYFGGEDRMVRIDLNEYSRPEDTSRILAVGADDPYSLCAQISKQPFSVVLLDEIEKSHPNVLNLLLQMLDEGILRDAENKPISFKDAIIIATSNAGADKIRAHIEKGEALEQFETSFINELITSNIFRPEFLNRFDETVLFRPLTQPELHQVVDLLMVGLNKTLAARKVTVSLTESAKQVLIQTGYDPRLGARPLRRTVQRAVENIVAQKLLSGEFTPGETMQIDAPEISSTLAERT